MTPWQHLRDILIPPRPPDPVQPRLALLEAATGALAEQVGAHGDRIDLLAARLDRAEQALRESGMAPCQVCEAWRSVKPGPETFRWTGEPCCARCVEPLIIRSPEHMRASLRPNVAKWLAEHHRRASTLQGRLVAADPDLMAYLLDSLEVRT